MRSLKRDKSFLLDDFLAGGRKYPLEVSLQVTSGFAGGVEVELARDGVLATAGHFRAGIQLSAATGLVMM